MQCVSDYLLAQYADCEQSLGSFRPTHLQMKHVTNNYFRCDKYFQQKLQSTIKSATKEFSTDMSDVVFDMSLTTWKVAQ